MGYRPPLASPLTAGKEVRQRTSAGTQERRHHTQSGEQTETYDGWAGHRYAPKDELSTVC